LERLFYRLALDTAHIVAIERVAKELKCGQATVEKNLGLLNESGLVQSLKLYPGTSRRGIGGSPKIILADPALLCAAFSGAGTFVVDEEMEGRLLESVVGAHLASFVKLKKGNLTYWRRGKHEVDFVLEIGNETIPIQVTRSKNIDPADMIGFAMFSQQHRKKATTGLLLYMGQETDRMVGTRKPMVVSCRNLALYLRHISQGIISYS
jgi:predicted AAA+ superfamily ATPase